LARSHDPSTSAGEGAHPGAARGAIDERALEALRAGDEETFLALVDRHHRAMVRVATLFVRSEAVAEEVAQEAWLGVLAGLAGFEGRASLRSWIFQILVHQAKARAAREARTVPISALAEDRDERDPSVPADRFLDADDRWPGHWATPPAPWPEERAASREALALVGAAVAALPALQRAVMTLRDVEGWASGEVCGLLGLSEGNERVLLHRARSTVRARLEAAFADAGPANGEGP
jgi:RNA polymerase sigma-70 factor (ECF subfamily)